MLLVKPFLLGARPCRKLPCQRYIFDITGTLKDGSVVGVMQIASSLADLDQALSVLTITMFALSPLILLACGLTGAAITGHAMRPVRTMVDAF